MFEFDVVDPVLAFDKQAFQSLKDRALEVVRALKSVKDLNLAIIDSKDISGWMPESNRWPKFKANIRSFIAAVGATGHHLNARNAEEVSKRFEEVAELMEDDMQIEEYA